MNSREEALARLATIQDVISQIDPLQFTLRAWKAKRRVDGQPDVEIRCAGGWVADKQLFGLQLTADNNPVVKSGGQQYFNYHAMMHVIFGTVLDYDDYFTAWKITTQLFGVRSEQDVGQDDRQAFLNRVPDAHKHIIALYDRLEANDPLICAAGV